ncbi:cytochrome o ubiquinol oxidase subunit IV [Buchnera aphidicola]|uniref:cytochrome o ubiquinol oxidase subunit IV n=1 Tax=Buchnera aphidicola TaxID=9 RepID=UPI003464CAD4
MSNTLQDNAYYYEKIKSYALGFLFSIILTALSFVITMTHFFSNKINYITIIICAIMQIFVHFVYFLNLNFTFQKHWYVISLLFVMIIVFIIVFGSIWIMSNLNHHMLLH